MNGEATITIRPETAADHTAIREVNTLAFGGTDEARLVDAVRQSTAFIPELSLVAVKAGRIIGHILFSPMAIETENGFTPALTLAPLAVRPEVQNKGIGAALVRQGLEECRRLDHSIAIVIGHPTYYPRFGFSSARASGLEAPFPVPDEAFMVLELVPGALNGVKGVVIYPPSFTDSEGFGQPPAA